MRIIYEPRGRALEYAPLAVSLYRGCSHGCTYCFAPDVTRTNRESFLQPSPRKDALKLLEKDAIELSATEDQREILLSFTTDPYQPLEQSLGLTRSAIQIFVKYGLHFTILTKGGNRSTRDTDLLESASSLCRYGTTLVFSDEKDREEWEPYAAPTTERIHALWWMKDHGIRTWVSLEPVIYPEQTIDLIYRTCGFVDEYRIGKLNHISHDIGDQELIEFMRKVRCILLGTGCRYIFKKDLIMIEERNR